MTLQGVNIFAEKNIFNAIENDEELKKHFVRNSENRNMFSFFETFATGEGGKDDLFDLQSSNNVNLAVQIINKKQKGEVFDYNAETQVKENKVYVNSNVSFYLFTYYPMRQINTEIEGIYTKLDYFMYIDALLTDFLKPLGLSNNLQRSGVYNNNAPYVEKVYNANITAQDYYKFANTKRLKIILSGLTPIKDK